VRFTPRSGPSWSDRWIIPTSASPLKVNQVRVLIAPTPDLTIQPSQIQNGGATTGQCLAWSGTSWVPGTLRRQCAGLEYMGIAQALPTAFKNTYDFLVQNEGYGLPVTRWLPYDDFGIILAQDVTASASPQTIQTASYGANRRGLEAGKFVHIDLGGPNEEYVKVVAVDPDNQTFDAIFTRDHVLGERIRPTIWPTAVLNEGDDLAFDILSVASPDSGSDLTVAIQT
jgi:hypothetical protein